MYLLARRTRVNPAAAPASEEYLPGDAEADAHATAEAEAQLPPPSIHEQWLMKILLLNDDSAEWVAAHLEPDWLPHPLVREVVTRRLAALAGGNWHGVATFLGGCESDTLRNLITAGHIAIGHRFDPVGHRRNGRGDA